MITYRFDGRRGPTEIGLRRNIANWYSIAGTATTLIEKRYAERKAYRIELRIEELRETRELNRGHEGGQGNANEM